MVNNNDLYPAIALSKVLQHRPEKLEFADTCQIERNDSTPLLREQFPDSSITPDSMIMDRTIPYSNACFIVARANRLES